MKSNSLVECYLKRRLFSSFPVILLSSSMLVILPLAGLAYGQTAPGDTAKPTVSAPAMIKVTIVRDTTAKVADSLSAAADTSKLADSLAAAQDTTGGKKDTLAAKKDTLQILSSTASYNTIPGYRVQILTTQDLSEAIGVKAKADSLLPNYNVYIVYDSPYYKVRVGNFRARYEAAQAVPFIASHGFPNAWSVPDNVFRNPVHRSN